MNFDKEHVEKTSKFKKLLGKLHICQSISPMPIKHSNDLNHQPTEQNHPERFFTNAELAQELAQEAKHLLAHKEQDMLVTKILSQIAKEKSKSLERIKRLLLIKKNNAINRRFWGILDTQLPNHGFSYVGHCTKCGLIALG